MSELDSRLRRWRAEFLRAAWLEGGARLAAGAGLGLVAAWIVDALWPLPSAARVCVFWVGLAAAGAAAYRLLARPALRLRAAALLDAAAARYRALSPMLMTAWELGRGGAEPGTSEALAREHVARTERLLEAAPREPLFPASLSPVARRSLAGVGLLASLSAPWLARVTPGLGRILAPWREVPLEELVEVSPGSIRAAWGTSVTVGARWRDPAQAGVLEFWVSEGPSGWGRVEWDRVAGGQSSYRFAELTARTRYRLAWRDQRTRVFALEPVPLPRLVGAKARVYLPGRVSATGESGSASEVRWGAAESPLEGSGEVAALRGSWVVVSGRAEPALSRAAVRVSYLNVPVEMRRAASGAWEAGFPLSEDGTFRFELVTEEGVTDPHPVSYQVKALADQPPTVELLSPAFEVEASPLEKLPVAYEARDDHGLTSVALLVGSKAIVLKRLAKGVAETIGDYAWDLSGLPLGTPIEFRIRATDDCALGPQSSLSRKGVVRLVDFEAAHAQTERSWLAVEKDLGALAEKEAAAVAAFKAMERASPEELARLRSAREAADRELVQAWSEAARGAKGLAESMSKDPYSNPGMTEAARASAEDLGQASSEEAPKAARAAREGDLTGARRRHERLEARARKAAKLLGSGKEMQSLQDFWSEAGRMDQAAAELDAALSSMANAKDGRQAPSADEKRRLDAALKDLARRMDELAKTIDSLPKAEEGSAKDKLRKVYTVPLNSARAAADELQKALAAGDWEGAARAAKRLSERLAQVRQAIADAARGAAQDGGGPGLGPEAAERLERAAARLQGLVDAQTRSLALAETLGESRMKAMLEAQKSLLAALAVRQKAAIDDAAPKVGFPLEALGAMRQVLAEFEAKEVARAPELLGRVVARLRARGGFEDTAREEAGILDALTKEASPPPVDASAAAQAGAARGAQAEVRAQTAEAQKELEAIDAETSALPPGTVETLGQAQGEQSSAEGALSRVEAKSAAEHESKALELLEKGLQAAEQGAASARKMQGGMTDPFSRRRGAYRPAGRATTGTDTGFVPLPSAKDYTPPKELREELEKSLRERRPKRYEPVIKDYLKRMSE